VATTFDFEKRLLKALSHRGVLNTRHLTKLVIKRAHTKTQAKNLMGELAQILEPPACTMAECKHYGGVANFCACKKGRTPQKCQEHRRLCIRKMMRDRAA
jgi:hypothetical protein